MAGTKSQKVMIEAILNDTASVLSVRDSVLVIEGRLDNDFIAQSEVILGEAFTAIKCAIDEGAVSVVLLPADYRMPPQSGRIGQMRARQNMHPGESMMAAEILFDTALTPFALWAAQLPAPVEPVEVARLLHHAIWRRFPAGAIAYAEVLRSKLMVASQESRLKISRDLHDRVAHGIVAGMQRIELSMLDATREDAELAAAMKILRHTLDDVQRIALDLRQLVGDRGLSQAIEDYAADTISVPPQIEVETTGTPHGLPAYQAEEVFMIVLEAIRNSRAHAGRAIQLIVLLDWTESALRVSIADDGGGFDYNNITAGSLGLIDMQERAESIGGDLRIHARTATGTCIVITLPLRSKR